MQRRPLMFISAGIISAIIIEYYMGFTLTFFTAMIMVLGISAQRPISKAGLTKKSASGFEVSEIKKITAVFIAVSYFIGASAFFIQSNNLDRQQDMLIKEDTATISGIIKNAENKVTESGDKYVQMKVRTEKGSVLVKYYEDPLNVMPGDEIEAYGSVSAPEERRNPGCFDYRLYLKSLNISSIMTADAINVKNTSRNTLPARLFALKESFLDQLEKSTDADTSALMRAIMFGDKGELDEKIMETFQKNGTAHILAVSGLHIGIIYGFILKLWVIIGNITNNTICGRRGVVFFCFNILFFTCYMIMSDYSPSVVRAVFMVFIHLFAQLTNRRYDLSNAAMAVVIISLLKNPYMLFNVGFQMSFIAVLTLVLVLPFVRHFYSGILLSSLVIQIGLGPFIVYNFNYLSIIAVFINVPVIYMAGILVPAGLISMILGGTSISIISAKATQCLCHVLQEINTIAEIPGLTTFQVSSPPLQLIVFYYLVLLTMATEQGRLAIIRAAGLGTTAAYKIKSGFIHVAKVCTLLVIVAACFVHVADDDFDKCNLTFVDVGQGDCMCIRSGGVYLIDGGGSVNYNLGKKTLRCYLLKNGMSHVDGAFITHMHTDHYKGICELCREGMVKKIFVYDGNRVNEQKIIDDTDLEPEAIEYISAGQSVVLGTGGLFNRHNESVEVLWPEKKSNSEYESMLADEEDENAMSLILKVHFRNKCIFGGINETELLVTGDLDEEGEKNLVTKKKSELYSEILKVAHHGSRYSSTEEFLDSVSPEFAVIQVGKNNYGHPSSETIDRLKEMQIATYRNDTMGAIGVVIEKGEIKKITKMIK